MVALTILSGILSEVDSEWSEFSEGNDWDAGEPPVEMLQIRRMRDRIRDTEMEKD